MPTNLTSAQMKECVQKHFDDFVNQRNTAVIHRNMTADFVDHDGPGGRTCGVDVDEKMMIGFINATSNLRVTVEEMIAEGDKVACRNIWRWVDPKSGKSMEMHGFVLWRFEGPKIAERWATVTQPAEGSGWTKN